jgi:integrase
MPRQTQPVPSYRLHKPSGQAVAYVKRKPVYLGPHGSPESKTRFAELLEKLATGSQDAPAPPKAAAPTMYLNDLCVRFVAKEFPRLSKSEKDCFRSAIRVARKLFGETPVSDFGPVRFRVMRDAMVDGDKEAGRQPWTRRTANRQSKRIRQIIRWGVSWELVTADVLARLETVKALAVGETETDDPPPREAAPQADIDAVREKLKPHHRDVFDLLLLTGARPGEILNLTGKLIERRDDGLWTADLSDHKNARKGKRRLLVFCTPAQAILLRYLKPDPEAKLFALRRDNFAAVIRRACRRAKVDPFVPYQLRHSVATQLYDEVGLEAAQAMLGHSDALMTLHYARAAEKAAMRAAESLG